MAQQQIITKPYVGELQDNDSLFINHDGALRQIKKSDADFASGTDMRAEVTAREAFEAQEVAAREAFEKSETEAREQFETSVEGQIAEKANVDGYYEEMTVGDAEQLVATQFVEDNEPYLFRPTGGPYDVGNRAYIDKIVGGTVAWNQLVDDSKAQLGTAFGVTLSRNENGRLFVSGTVQTGYTRWLVIGEASLIVGHKYLSRRIGQGIPLRIENLNGNVSMIFNNDFEVKTLTEISKKAVYAQIREGATVNLEIVPVLIDLTQMFGAGNEPTAEQFTAMFPASYYPYNAGELLSVGGLQSHDTVGFNQWDEEWEVGSYGSDGLPIVSDDSIRTKNKISVKPSTAYYFKNGGSGNLIIFWYDDNDIVISYEYTNNDIKTSPANAKYLRFRTNNYGTTYNHDICINLSDPSRNGEYEPYEKHSYPLDSSLTLRGIPKLDASNNLYYDGDEYTSDGKVKRKYGVITLDGTSGKAFTGAWGSSFDNPNGYAVYTTSIRSKTSKVISNRFIYNGWEVDSMPLYSFVGGSGAADTWTFILPNTVTSLSEANAWLANNPTTIVYELATPTTETAEPFQHIQIVDDFGTEEFVSTGIVPVGHKTRYPANLRDKLQHLPDLASTDGTYLIRQTGKQMSLIHMPAIFPEIPTEDGTYTLKTVVTGGVATLQWLAE